MRDAKDENATKATGETECLILPPFLYPLAKRYFHKSLNEKAPS